jgi:hypothetical protein
LHHGPMEKASGRRRGQVRTRTQRTRRLAEQRDGVRITTERRRVASHPTQRSLLILQPEIPRVRQTRMPENPSSPSR